MLTYKCQHTYSAGKYTYRMDLGTRIATLRKAKGWTQKELAKRVRVSRPAVTQWESGHTENIRLDNLRLLANAFGLTVDALLTDSEMVREESPTYGGGPLTREEESLLEKYRHLNPNDRSHIRAITDALDTAGSKAAGNDDNNH